MGKKVTFVIVAEGALDVQGRLITSEAVKQAIIDHMGMDARVTTLGHVQRGGHPSAFDRYLATIQGITATVAIVDNANQTSLSLLTVINENHVTLRPITECVARTKQIGIDLRAGNFEAVFKARDPEFKFLFELHGLFCSQVDVQATTRPNLTIALINIGAPCGGMNAANAAIVKYCVTKGHAVLGAYDGIRGFMDGKIQTLDLPQIQGCTERGGSFLGTNRWLPESDNEVELLVGKIVEKNIDAIIMVGGFEGFAFLKLLRDNAAYLRYNFPVLLIPATVSNNVPGTEYSIGSDTALNTVIGSCDIVRQSASSSGNRVFVVEVQGGNCGYLATMSALSSGASCCFIPEKKVGLRSMMAEIDHLKFRFQNFSRLGRIVIRNENCSPVYTTEIMSKILEDESDGKFDSRWIVLGHLQQGGNPSPIDRLRGVRLGIVCVDYIQKILFPVTDIPDSGIPIIGIDSGVTTPYHRGGNLLVVGVKGPKIVFTPFDSLHSEADMKNRRVQNPWWMRLYPLISMLSRGPQESNQQEDLNNNAVMDDNY